MPGPKKKWGRLPSGEHEGNSKLGVAIASFSLVDGAMRVQFNGSSLLRNST